MTTDVEQPSESAVEQPSEGGAVDTKTSKAPQQNAASLSSSLPDVEHNRCESKSKHRRRSLCRHKKSAKVPIGDHRNRMGQMFRGDSLKTRHNQDSDSDHDPDEWVPEQLDVQPRFQGPDIDFF
jgi:hypothetical protein